MSDNSADTRTLAASDSTGQQSNDQEIAGLSDSGHPRQVGMGSRKRKRGSVGRVPATEQRKTRRTRYEYAEDSDDSFVASDDSDTESDEDSSDNEVDATPPPVVDPYPLDQGPPQAPARPVVQVVVVNTQPGASGADVQVRCNEATGELNATIDVQPREPKAPAQQQAEKARVQQVAGTTSGHKAAEGSPQGWRRYFPFSGR